MNLSLLHDHDNLAVYEIYSQDDFQTANKYFPLAGLYDEQILNSNRLFLLITDLGAFIADLPKEPGDKGELIDANHEQAIFEDILQLHRKITWESCKEMMTLFIKIDPCLPFDLEIEAAEAYQVAVDQFPLVLDMDREIPDHLAHLVNIPDAG